MADVYRQIQQRGRAALASSRLLWDSRRQGSFVNPLRNRGELARSGKRGEFIAQRREAIYG